jgi:phosphotransferase system HPr (HPr) family protein
MKKLTLLVHSEVGLHARPAALFVDRANRYESEILVRNLSTHSDWADAKSILSVLTLGVEKDHQIELQVSGLDEAPAVAALAALVDAAFGEGQGSVS